MSKIGSFQLFFQHFFFLLLTVECRRSSNLKDLVKMYPKNGLIVFLTIFCESKILANMMNTFLFSKITFRMASNGSNITTKTFKNNYKHSLAIYNILSQNLGQHSKCSKFGISTKSENVNFNKPTFWAQTQTFSIMKFLQQFKKPNENAPQEWAFVFFWSFSVSQKFRQI